jgi:hypothetical protein
MARLQVKSRTMMRADALAHRELRHGQGSIQSISSEVGTGSREENASKQKARASVPLQSERKRL